LESRTKLQHVRQAARPTCGLPQRSAQLHDCCTPAPRVCPAGAKQCTSACPRMDIAARRQQRQLQPQQLRCVKAGPQARAPAGQPRSGRQQTAAAPALSARTPRGTAWSVARGCASPAAPAGPRRPARAALARLRWRTMHRCRAPPPPAPWRRARAAPACRAAAAAPRSWAARSCCARAAGTGRGSAAHGALRPRPARSVLLSAASLPGARPLVLPVGSCQAHDGQGWQCGSRHEHDISGSQRLLSSKQPAQEQRMRMDQLTKHSDQSCLNWLHCVLTWLEHRTSRASCRPLKMGSRQMLFSCSARSSSTIALQPPAAA